MNSVNALIQALDNAADALQAVAGNARQEEKHLKLWEFTSAKDRDSTMLMVLSFAAVNAVMMVFQDNLSQAPQVVISLVAQATGWITNMVMFYFTSKQAHQIVKARRMNPFEFENSEDRDGTLLMFLAFGTAGHMIGHFHNDLSTDGVIAISSTVFGWVSSMVMFMYKSNGKSTAPKEDKED